MVKSIFIQIGYMDTLASKSMKRLTADVMESLMTSHQVATTMLRIEAESDEEKKNELKKGLPVVLFACQMPEDGVRPTAATAIPSGFCMHDWDGMPVSPREFYAEKIAGHEKELGIVLAHITPRGKGLRLVTVLEKGERIVDAQKRLASQFGMEQFADQKVKDLSRISFLPSIDYLLYVDKAGLFERVAVTETPVQAENANPSTPVATQRPTLVATAPKVAENFPYEDGIKYSDIIEALLNRIATQGQPQVGERNDDLYLLVRELRHICEYNFDKIYMLVAPYFPSLQDAEIRRTISSAISSTGRSITPVMLGVLNELKNALLMQNIEPETKRPKLPAVSEIEELVLSKYPKHLREQVYFSMLTIWGTYGTHIRFDYMDGRENSLSFMTSVVGKSGSGKAFAAHLFESLTKRIQAEDMLERMKADEYLSLCNRKGDNSEKPEDPRPRVRIYGDDITTSQLLEYLDNLKGEHGLQFTEEIARLQKAKKTIYGDNDDLYCKGFDNGVGGKESKSKQTRNIRIKIFLNTLFCGTPGAMHRFYNNPEGGLNNRVIFTFMPSVQLKGFPHYEKLNETEQKQLDEVIDRLIEAGKDGSKVRLPWLEEGITKINSKWSRDDDDNPNQVWRDLGKRSLVIAMRAGVLEWHLRGCPSDEKSQRDILKLVRWVADTVRRNMYLFSGDEYEAINERDNQLSQKHERQTKNKQLFAKLADEFTVQELATLRVQNGDNPDVRMVISRWVDHGMIEKIAQGRFRKRRQLQAKPFMSDENHM